MLQPPSWPKIGDLQLALLWKKNIHVEKQNVKWGKKKKKNKGKGFGSKNRKSKKWARNDEKNLIEYTVVLFNQTKANNKKQKRKRYKLKDKRRQETRKETKDWWEKNIAIE